MRKKLLLCASFNCTEYQTSVPIATATAIANRKIVCMRVNCRFFFSPPSLSFIRSFSFDFLSFVNLHLSLLHSDISYVFRIFPIDFCCAINVANQWQRKPIICFAYHFGGFCEFTIFQTNFRLIESIFEVQLLFCPDQWELAFFRWFPPTFNHTIDHHAQKSILFLQHDPISIINIEWFYAFQRWNIKSIKSKFETSQFDICSSSSASKWLMYRMEAPLNWVVSCIAAPATPRKRSNDTNII